MVRPTLKIFYAFSGQDIAIPWYALPHSHFYPPNTFSSDYWMWLLMSSWRHFVGLFEACLVLARFGRGIFACWFVHITFSRDFFQFVQERVDASELQTDGLETVAGMRIPSFWVRGFFIDVWADVYDRAMGTKAVSLDVNQIIPLVMARAGYEKRRLDMGNEGTQILNYFLLRFNISQMKMHGLPWLDF
jgi:hypothetical protein